MENPKKVLGGSWVVISGVISPLLWAITIVTLLMTPLNEPPSRSFRVKVGLQELWPASNRRQKPGKAEE